MGNDFIPHPIGLSIASNGINILKTVCKNTCLISKDDTVNINKTDLHLIFKNLIAYEEKCMINEPKNWRKNYYRNEVYIEDISQSCKLYIDGIFWTYNYYNKDINKIDHSWYYPYLGCPSISDIANYLTTYEYKPSYDNNFINSKEQLIIVMPKTSINVLPKDLHQYMNDPLYGLDYMFVSDYKLIKYLKKNNLDIRHIDNFKDLCHYHFSKSIILKQFEILYSEYIKLINSLLFLIYTS
jgi:5'-3' exonuclease